MQIKAAIIYYYILIRMKWKTAIKLNAGENVEKLDHSYLRILEWPRSSEK